jgi:hypothetical protein
VRTPLPQLLAENGLPALPDNADHAPIANNYYCTSVLSK